MFLIILLSIVKSYYSSKSLASPYISQGSLVGGGCFNARAQRGKGAENFTRQGHKEALIPLWP